MTSPSFEPVIGLEVHVELLTRTKMFCPCAVVDPAQSEPNRSVCEICMGLPGTLPVINERAVELALRVALALGCRVAPESLFARKNYFYPDLPKGFQISQYEAPLASGGVVKVPFEGRERTVRIRRVHLEEDTGKLVHRGQDSLVDFNRAGVPLLEIVSEPDLTSVEQAKAFATELRSLLRTLGVTSGDMEKGAIRFEANISVRPSGATTLGTRTEIKNLNSFRAMVRAVTYEIERQGGGGGGRVRPAPRPGGPAGGSPSGGGLLRTGVGRRPRRAAQPPGLLAHRRVVRSAARRRNADRRLPRFPAGG